MANVLKITTPNITHNQSQQTRTTVDRNIASDIQGPIQPSRVLKPDARSDSTGQEQGIGRHFRYESNYQNFIKQVQSFPTVSEGFAKLFFERFATIATSGLSKGFADELASFFDFSNISIENMPAFLKQQMVVSSRFQGAFFNLLRQVMDQTNSVELKSDILNFLKTYTDMSESSHLLKQIDTLIENISARLYPNEKSELSLLRNSLLAQSNSPSEEAITANSKLLKESILPFLNKFVSSTHDRGELRDQVALLSSLIARHENSLPSRVIAAFETLLGYQGMQQSFTNLDSNILLQVLQNTDFEKQSRNRAWQENFIHLIESGIKGGAGIDNVSVFKNLLQSFLLNESVYMPLQHIIFPMQSENRNMFAQMWIDPNAEGNSRYADPNSRAIQGLLKFDIQDLGFFDLFFIYQDSNIKLQLSCPPSLPISEQTIQADLAQLLAANNIRAEELYIEKTDISIPISTAFPKIFERENAINVKI